MAIFPALQKLTHMWMYETHWHIPEWNCKIRNRMDNFNWKDCSPKSEETWLSETKWQNQQLCVQSSLKKMFRKKNIDEKNWQILKSIDKYWQNQHLFPISSELTMEMENIERSQLWREQLQKTGFMILIPIWRISIYSRWQFQHKRFLLFKQTITVKREVCSNTNGKHQFLKFA